jgi:hypothetical protein
MKTEALQGIRLYALEQLDQGHSTAGDGRHGDNFMALVMADEGLSPLGLIAAQVFVADDAPIGLHIGHDAIGHWALIKTVHASVSDLLECPSQLGLKQGIAYFPDGSFGQIGYIARVEAEKLAAIFVEASGLGIS